MVFSGVISEATGGSAPTDDVLSLMKIGTGKVTLSGANTYHGTTTVSQGTLVVANTTGSATGFGDVTVASGATLTGNGRIAPSAGNDITISSGAILDVGTPGAVQAESMEINLGAGSTLNLAGTLTINLFANDAATTTVEADRLVFSGTGGAVDLSGGTSMLKVATSGSLDASTFNVGDTWKLIDWAGISPTGTFSNLTGDYSNNFIDLPDLGFASNKLWDLRNLYTQGTIIVAVPEPGRLMLLIFGILALGWRRRRRLGQLGE